MIEVTRNTTHPWSAVPGWDLMTISARTHAGLVALIQSGKDKFWHLFWASGAEAIMYKPAGAAQAWEDKEQWLGRDRDKSMALSVGDVVYTNFSGQVTRHTITERQPDFGIGETPAGQLRKSQISGSGALIKVQPDVPKSGGGWMDPGWFRALDFAAAAA